MNPFDGGVVWTLRFSVSLISIVFMRESACDDSLRRSILKNVFMVDAGTLSGAQAANRPTPSMPGRPCVYGVWNSVINACKCWNGYSGTACDVPECDNGVYSVDQEECQCYHNYHGSRCQYKCVHGRPIFGKCECSRGYEGYSCEQRSIDSPSMSYYNSSNYNTIFIGLAGMIIAIAMFSCLSSMKKTRMRRQQAEMLRIMTARVNGFNSRPVSGANGSSRSDLLTAEMIAQMQTPPPKYEDIVLSNTTSSRSVVPTVASTVPIANMVSRPDVRRDVETGDSAVESPPNYFDAIARLVGNDDSLHTSTELSGANAVALSNLRRPASASDVATEEQLESVVSSDNGADTDLPPQQHNTCRRHEESDHHCASVGTVNRAFVP